MRARSKSPFWASAIFDASARRSECSGGARYGRGGRKALGCTWCVSITGIAGPSGGSAEKPVGTVCFGLSGPGVEEACWKVFPAGGGRQDIQRQAALFAFDFLLSAMR